MNRKLRSLILMFLAVFMVTALSLTVSAEGRDRSKEKVPASQSADRVAKGISSIKLQCYNSVKGGDIRWTSVSRAYEYWVWRYRPADGGWSLVDIVYNKKQLYDTEIKSGCWGRVYRYEVDAYDWYDNLVGYSAGFTLQRLAPMKFTSYSAKSTSSIYLKWACTVSDNKSSGYEVQYAKSSRDLTNRSGTFRTKRLSGRSSLSTTITGLAANTNYYFRIRAYCDFTNNNGTRFRSWSQFSKIATVKTTVAATNYRALLIGNGTYTYEVNLGGAKNDSKAMAKMFEAYGYRTAIRNDRTASQMVSDIRYHFKNAKSNDVSVFFFSGHGSTYSGALCGRDSSLLYLSTLASELKKVPGRVVIILDSCGSGGGVSSKDIDGFNPEKFDQMVISAFASADPGLEASAAKGTDAQEKYGELRNSKFLVLTASRKNETSSDLRVNGVWGGAMTRKIVEGAGCAFPSGTYNYRGIPADRNGDRKLSLYEVHKYSSSRVSGQHISCYPTNCSTVFMRVR